LKYNNTLLILKYIRYKYDNNYTLIKIINTIHKQLLIKIIKIIFNNQLELYGIIENNIGDNNRKVNNKWIQIITHIPKELIDGTMKTCINTIRYRSSSWNRRRKSIQSRRNNFKIFKVARRHHTFQFIDNRIWVGEIQQVTKIDGQWKNFF